MQGQNRREWEDSQLRNVDKLVDIYNSDFEGEVHSIDCLFIDVMNYVLPEGDTDSFYRVYDALKEYLVRFYGQDCGVDFDVGTFQILAAYAFLSDEGYGSIMEFIKHDTYRNLARTVIDRQDINEIRASFDNLNEADVITFLMGRVPKYYATPSMWGEGMEFVSAMAEEYGLEMIGVDGVFVYPDSDGCN